MSKPTITICTSASFYKQANDIQDQLEKEGLEVIIPTVAKKMRTSGDYDVMHYKTWFADPDDYSKKADLMRKHFDAVVKSDAVLVLNYEKNGQPNYIGGNVLMEMALAFYYKKPIFILNDVPENSVFLEEILGFSPVVLKGKLNKLIESFSNG